MGSDWTVRAGDLGATYNADAGSGLIIFSIFCLPIDIGALGGGET